VTDRRSLSRRKLLWAAATVGAAASTGSGAAAVLSDSEDGLRGDVTAGVVDLTTSPEWGNSDSLGTISKRDSGSKSIDISVTNNPAYVWFRTDCKQCEPIEESLYVRYGLDTDGDGTADQDLSGGFVSLRDAREQFGEGFHLGTLSPDAEWTLIAEWKMQDHVQTSTLPLTFDFYATQRRHVASPDGVRLPSHWDCGDCEDPPETEKEDGLISWVAFCGSEVLETDFTPQRTQQNTLGDTLLLDTDAYTIPEFVDTIAIKYAQTIEVFDYTGQDSVTVDIQNGTTHDHLGGNTYKHTDRSSSNFCNGQAGCKYDFGQGWTDCQDGVVVSGDTNGESSNEDGDEEDDAGPPEDAGPPAGANGNSGNLDEKRFPSSANGSGGDR
jgi:hypothetical protein